jgi:hypothetical protein
MTVAMLAPLAAFFALFIGLRVLRSISSTLISRGRRMVFTVVMFFVLMACYVAMLGLVKFSENVIAEPQFVPLGDGTATSTTHSAKSHKKSA